MRGMILAAGRGARMGEMTKNTPKPLLKIKGKYLIEYAVHSLIEMDIKEIVINISYLGDQIKNALGDGSRYGVKFFYSEEKEALETGGGIFQALPLLGDSSFIVMSSDIITDYPFKKMIKKPEKLAHLILVTNPDYHPKGDYSLRGNQVYCGEDRFTFASIGIYHRDLFENCKPGKFRLAPLLNEAIEKNLVTGEVYSGQWCNVGTEDEYLKMNSE